MKTLRQNQIFSYNEFFMLDYSLKLLFLEKAQHIPQKVFVGERLYYFLDI